MKLTYIIIFLFINILSLKIFSQTIAIVNVQNLIDNNKIYQKILKDIEINQVKHLKDFNLMENELSAKLNEIEEAKLILSEEEINKQIEDYNNQLSQFSIKIEEFNFHYQNEIINIREAILKEILKLLEKYALENSVDLILDSTTYLIASNSLDITTDINSELEKLNLNLEYKDFEKN
ncbi:OmpH family outer membrane protein [Pelagibacteraceae bacterium]|nr:OmpH family outer membrane protein [Pelagibacteraceae bacterium]